MEYTSDGVLFSTITGMRALQKSDFETDAFLWTL